MQETWVQFLGQEDPLEKEMVIHSSILAWKIPWTEEPSRLQSMGSQESDMTSQLNHHHWSWNSNTLATWCEELTPWKRPWCWEILKAGGEVDNRGWDGWMASLTLWTWVWVSSGCWWWTGRPGMLQSMGSERVRHDWVTELNWCFYCQISITLVLWDWSSSDTTFSPNLTHLQQETFFKKVSRSRMAFLK